MRGEFEREWTHRGLSCRVWLNPVMQIRCGYVDVPEGHPLHGHGCDSPEVDELDVHGGITFAKKEDGAWRIGFDCGHCFDFTPLMPELGGRVWSLEEVMRETESLADQVADMAIGGER